MKWNITENLSIECREYSKHRTIQQPDQLHIIIWIIVRRYCDNRNMAASFDISIFPMQFWAIIWLLNVETVEVAEFWSTSETIIKWKSSANYHFEPLNFTFVHHSTWLETGKNALNGSSNWANTKENLANVLNFKQNQTYTRKSILITIFHAHINHIWSPWHQSTPAHQNRQQKSFKFCKVEPSKLFIVWNRLSQQSKSSKTWPIMCLT